MKKTLIFIVSILLIISSLSVVCFASNKIAVATGNDSNNVVIKDDSERTKTTAPKTTEAITPQTDPITTNVYQYVESIKKNTEVSVSTSDSIDDSDANGSSKTELTTSVKNKKIYMNVTFISEVPDGVSGDISISVYNKDTGDTFDFILPKSNHYFLMEEIPVGHYIYTKVNIPNNENNRFVAEYASFTIGYVMNSIVNFEVIDTKSTETQIESIITETISNTIITSETVDFVVKPETKKESKFKTIVIPVIVLIFIIALYIFKKFNKKNIEDNDVQYNAQTPTNRF